jgi:RHS repeat-associated protein
MKNVGARNASCATTEHARFYGPVYGRFLSVDPMLDMRRTVTRPQLWNRYNYALDNTVVYGDPSGAAVYVVAYTVGNEQGDDEFQRAAMTRAARIRGMRSFDPKRDTVILSGVRNKADFSRTLATAKALGSTFGKVGELSMFSHAGPTDRPAFHHGVAPLEQFSKGDLKALSVNWEWWGNAKFFGRNTGLGFNQRFADAQGVTAHGFTSFASFSGSRDGWSVPWGSGPLYMVQTRSNFTTGDYAGAAAKWLGLDREVVAMEPADPRTP